MRVGVAIDETWSFFREIYADLSDHHYVEQFKPHELSPPFFQDRINRYLFRRDLQDFLSRQDVVFFEWASHWLAAASHMEKTCGVVTRLHRYEMYQWLERIDWNFVDRIIMVSQAKRSEFTHKFPEHAHKVVVIPVGISFRQFIRKETRFRGNLGTLCHLAPRKRVYDLILSFYELAKRHDGYHLHIGGGMRPLYSDYYDVLHALVHRLNLRDSVTLYCHVSEPSKWFSNIDIFISNSYSEGLQVSPMEAIASGCFCLSHWWDGADELLPEDDLFITEEELLEKILDFSEVSEAERQRRRDAQYARVRDRFDIEDTKVLIRKLTERVGSDWIRRSTAQ